MNVTPSDSDNKLGLTDADEINLKEAEGVATVEFLIADLDDDIPISTPLILELHRTAFGQLYDWAGKWRTTTPIVGSYLPPSPGQLPNLMYQFVEELNFRLQHIQTEKEVVSLMAYAHARLVQIHPFTNGNGRMARILTNLIALRLGYAPIEIYTQIGGNRKEYIQAIQATDLRDYRLLESLISAQLRRLI